MMYGLPAHAITWPGLGCDVESISAESTVFTSDLASAAQGSVVGNYVITLRVNSCNNSQPRSIALPMQPQGKVYGNNACLTSVPGIELFTQSIGVACSTPGIQGPIIATLPSTFSSPITRVITLNYIKTGPVPQGVHKLEPAKVSPFYYGQNEGTSEGWLTLDHEVPSDPGNIISTTCSLATTHIAVDFGNDAKVEDIQNFEMEFDNCTDLSDARNYHTAVSLNFHSERLRADGAAVRNNACTDCAQGIQIALKDSEGNKIDLSRSYALKNNKSASITNNRLNYRFLAELQKNEEERLKNGVIDTQLVFEAVIE